jgi:hypothetical protein
MRAEARDPKEKKKVRGLLVRQSIKQRQPTYTIGVPLLPTHSCARAAMTDSRMAAGSLLATQTHTHTSKQARVYREIEQPRNRNSAVFRHGQQIGTWCHFTTWGTPVTGRWQRGGGREGEGRGSGVRWTWTVVQASTHPAHARNTKGGRLGYCASEGTAAGYSRGIRKSTDTSTDCDLPP